MRACVASLVLIGRVASAEPITAPDGWTNDPALAATPEGFRFGGASTRVSVSAHRPAVRGAVLHMNRAEAEVAAERRDALATAELDELRGALRRQGADAKAESSVQRFDPVKLQLEATLAWRDATAGVVDISRIVIAADAKRIVAVTGQCVLAIDVPSEISKACEAALATIDPEVPPASRVALAIVGDPGEVAAASEPSSDRPKPPPAQLDDGSRVVLPPIHVTPDAPASDRRPVYIGFGLIVLAALFYLNRRRREQLDRDEARRERGDGPADAPVTSAGDADADDLHAAAAAVPDAPAPDLDAPGATTPSGGPDNGKGEQP